MTRKLITFCYTGGDIHKCDRAGEESVVQLPQASDKGFLLVKVASGPLVNLIELQIKIQACLDVNSQLPHQLDATCHTTYTQHRFAAHFNGRHRCCENTLCTGRKNTSWLKEGGRYISTLWFQALGFSVAPGSPIVNGD